MAELLITSSLDPIEEEQVFMAELPRHVTIWQYFTIADEYVGEFMITAGEVISPFPPIEIRGIENHDGENGPDLFGPNNDTPVRRVEKVGHGATVSALHAVLGGVITQFDGDIHNPEWAYEGYNPHITYTTEVVREEGKGLPTIRKRALEVGETAVLGTVELIQRFSSPKYKVVRKVWELEDMRNTHETPS